MSGYSFMIATLALAMWAFGLLAVLRPARRAAAVFSSVATRTV